MTVWDEQLDLCTGAPNIQNARLSCNAAPPSRGRSTLLLHAATRLSIIHPTLQSLDVKRMHFMVHLQARVCT